MQKKEKIQIIISLAFLLISTVVAYWLSNEAQFEKVDKNIFKVDNFKNINKVILESKTRKVELKFNGTRWLVNDKYDADRNLVDILFATLQQAEPKRPVASSIKDSLSNIMESEGTKVSLSSSDKIEKIFIAGGNQQKTQAYFKEVDNDKPYIIIIPGYRVYASGIFELDENNWRDKRIFNFNWKNFKTLETTIPAKQNQSFKVASINHQFTIEGLPSVDTTKLNNYLDAVSLLSADKFIADNQNFTYDSLASVLPVVIIDVTDVADRHYQLSVYPKLKNDENIVGEIMEGQLASFSTSSIASVLKNKDYFVKKR